MRKIKYRYTLLETRQVIEVTREFVPINHTTMERWYFFREGQRFNNPQGEGYYTITTAWTTWTGTGVRYYCSLYDSKGKWIEGRIPFTQKGIIEFFKPDPSQYHDYGGEYQKPTFGIKTKTP